jgi:putative hydrolase of the HAD superfamily
MDSNMPFDAIAFDADDTLWHSESLYAAAQEEYRRLLAVYAEAETIDRVLHQTEMRNLSIYGYGIKGFALSMIEAALELSQQRISGNEIQRVLDLAKQMLRTDVELLEGVAEVIAQLAATYPLMLITKGDLVHQEAKIDQSGLRPYFRSIEIVADKTPQSYAALLTRYHIDPALRHSARTCDRWAGCACAVCHHVGA